MDDLGQTLAAMDSTRLLLALMFVAGYACSIGHLASERGRRWSAAVAALTGLAFTGLTNPWVHGALLIVFVVLSVGAFIALAWLFSLGAARWQAASASVLAVVPVPAPASGLPPAASTFLVSRHVEWLRRRLSTL